MKDPGADGHLPGAWTIPWKGTDMAERSALERFEEKVDRSGSCHRWTGAHTTGPHQGYGHFWYEGKVQRAHVVALLLEGIVPPPGMTVDHVQARGCRFRDCVRIDHLEIVSQRENILRSGGPAALNARKTHCKRGHALPTQPTRSCGRRSCPTCSENRNAERRAKRRPDEARAS